ncbi:MAG: adenylate/guanylate cyclase domain-containing protein [Pseudomonadota bacterium]
MRDIGQSGPGGYAGDAVRQVRAGARRAGGMTWAIASSTGRMTRHLRGQPIFGQAIGLVSSLINFGTHDYPEETRRRLKILNFIAYLIGATTFIYCVQHLSTDIAAYWPLIIVNVALVSLAIIVPLSHRISPIAGGVIVVVVEWAALLLICAMIGSHAGVQLQYFIGAAAPFVVFGLERMRLVLATVISGAVLHVICWSQFPPETAWLDLPPEMITGIYTQASITTVAMIAAAVWYAFTLVEAAKAETDAVLRNILPDTVVTQLKQNPDAVIAQQHENVAVLFADIAGFVALSKSLGAERTVVILNDLIRRFDVLASEHGIEKIKTIGDAYMAAAGVPEPVDDPVGRMARFAMAMVVTAREVAAQHDINLALRTGIAVGPLTAGVIGARKFSYDIWGDTVNLAARLEGNSAPGRILVCPDCRTALEWRFDLEPRGEIEIKGVGRRPVWFIEHQQATRDEAAKSDV